MRIIEKIKEIREKTGISQEALARLVGTSFASIAKWESGSGSPGSSTSARIQEIIEDLRSGKPATLDADNSMAVFASRRKKHPKWSESADLFEFPLANVQITASSFGPVLERLRSGAAAKQTLRTKIAQLLIDHNEPAPTIDEPPKLGVSAGKNTYTYDAHTYHTKVPPQGIAELIEHYLPHGGLVLDPFAGSGMTGVAARTTGADCILNELSPAASFIADRFNSEIDPDKFQAGVRDLMRDLAPLRQYLYSTKCRECQKNTEILYTVWSYKVICPHCEEEFSLWDHCRSYGKTVREHKILGEFPCPSCKRVVKKSRLKRTTSHPVLLGYRCCSSAQIEHPLSKDDLALIAKLEKTPMWGSDFVPSLLLPDGANLGQPKNHGLTSVDKFYTARNLAAMSRLWSSIHRFEDVNLAGFLAFVFTSLYQRVTKLSEFRFWGGSGNSARFNVPYISNEANVFATFERKARSIVDHLETTARHYRGKSVVVTGSATNLNYLPDGCIDLIFTDPPFGANINYSDMNMLWEAWLGELTDNTEEAIVNKFQHKGVAEYEDLMRRSLMECYRVLRPGHWLLLVFMNSTKEVWESLRRAITRSGFEIKKIDIFDKQHASFKQYVHENTAGCDLVLHCRKSGESDRRDAISIAEPSLSSVRVFLESKLDALPMSVFLHVNRQDEIDYRQLYSEWLAAALTNAEKIVDFATFRELAKGIFSTRVHST